MTYRRRPVEVEARQWNGGREAGLEVVAWLRERGGDGDYRRKPMNPAEPMREEWLNIHAVRKAGSSRGWLNVGGWVVCEGGRFTGFMHEHFVRLYEEVP